jgi:hypothetical protein
MELTREHLTAGISWMMILTRMIVMATERTLQAQPWEEQLVWRKAQKWWVFGCWIARDQDQ